MLEVVKDIISTLSLNDSEKLWSELNTIKQMVDREYEIARVKVMMDRVENGIVCKRCDKADELMNTTVQGVSGLIGEYQVWYCCSCGVQTFIPIH